MTLSAVERRWIERLPLLSTFSDEEREDLLSACTTASWEAGQPVVVEGEDGTELYLVLDGSARVTIRADGRDIVLADLEPGELFGEEALLSGDPRSATITASSPLRCAVLCADMLDVYLEDGASPRRFLEHLSTRRLHERLVRSVAALQDLELGDTQHHDVSRVSYPAQALLFEHGEASDAVFFVLDGIAAACRDGADGREVLSRMGPGQCVGEVGVLMQRPRSASVFAETPLTTLRVDAGRFRSWVERNPHFADYLGTLQRIYPVADGRLVSVYRRQLEGRQAITTLAGDPAGDCVVSTKVLGEDTVLLARCSREPPGEQDVVRHKHARNGKERELLLDVIERGTRGEIRSASIHGVRSRGVGPDVPELYRALRDRQVIDATAIKRFRRTGYLGGSTPARDVSNVCTCLGIGRAELDAALDEFGRELKTVTDVLGLGAVCGACLAHAREIILDETPVTDPVPVAAPEPARSGLVARRPVIDFDVEAIQRLAAEPEMHAIAVASLYATLGERFIIQSIKDALPRLNDPALVADVEVFLEQESHHITTHEPLNRLLLQRVYPDNRALRRCAGAMVGRPDKLPAKAALGTAAAFEYLGDCTFGAALEKYYARGRRYSTEPQLHDLIEQSGVGPLFLWHGGEELAHRHVAFEVMRASGAGWPSRFVGFTMFSLQAFALLFPALISLRRQFPRRLRALPQRRVDFDIVQIARIVARALRFLRPRFHPDEAHHRFLADLEQDMQDFPEA